MKTDVKINVHIISASFRRFTICFSAEYVLRIIFCLARNMFYA